MNARGVSLLIVDYDAPIRKLLEFVALRAGFEVETARDGVEALEMMEAKQYSIAIIDLMMPRLSGYDLVQKISAMDARPVIIVATAMTNGDIAKIDDTLVKRVIKKPFDVNSVAEALVDTARQIADRQSAADAPVEVAPAQNAVIRVIEPHDEVTEAEKKKNDENQAHPLPKPH